MRPIANPIGASAVVALVLMSAVSVGAGIGSARAEDCLAAPNGASPAGQHWYYRIDRTTRRHCWYLAMLRSAHHTRHAAALVNENADQPEAAAPTPVAAAPIPFATAPIPFPAAAVPAAPLPVADPPAAVAAPAADNAPSLPHVTVLAVKTIAVRPPGAHAQSRQRADGAAASEASARVYSAAPDKKSEPTMFFFLVFGLGLMTFLMGIVIKRVAPQATLFWRVRTADDMAWQQERPNYPSAGPARLDSGAVIGFRRIGRRVIETRQYADESAEPEYERA